MSLIANDANESWGFKHDNVAKKDDDTLTAGMYSNHIINTHRKRKK